MLQFSLKIVEISHILFNISMKFLTFSSVNCPHFVKYRISWNLQRKWTKFVHCPRILHETSLTFASSWTHNSHISSNLIVCSIRRMQIITVHFNCPIDTGQMQCFRLLPLYLSLFPLLLLELFILSRSRSSSSSTVYSLSLYLFFFLSLSRFHPFICSSIVC